LAQVPTAVLGFLLILLAMVLAVGGVTLAHNRVSIDLRKAHTLPLSLINGGLNIMFGVIVGFSAFLVLNKYLDAQQAVQSEAADVEKLYTHAEDFPEPKRNEIQGLTVAYARAVVDEEWPLMREGSTSPRVEALAEELRRSIVDFKPTTSAQQTLYAHVLGEMDDLGDSRETRILYISAGLPSLLWVALVCLPIVMITFSCLVGMENRRWHLLVVSAFAVSIVLVLFTIGVLDRPFGTDFGVKSEPLELALHEMDGNGGR
jgi:Protein of unknown function (DUF4239)